jgi:hypothetical protein
MYVQYVKRANPKARYPLLLWHDGGLTGVTWESKPAANRAGSCSSYAPVKARRGRRRLDAGRTLEPEPARGKPPTKERH